MLDFPLAYTGNLKPKSYYNKCSACKSILLQKLWTRLLKIWPSEGTVVCRWLFMHVAANCSSWVENCGC